MLYGGVGIGRDVDQQRAADLFCPLEILDVPVMQRVEGAVYHGNLLPVLLQILVPSEHAFIGGPEGTPLQTLRDSSRRGEPSSPPRPQAPQSARRPWKFIADRLRLQATPRNPSSP